MASHATPLPALNGASRRRWTELLGNIAGLIPAGPAFVLIDGDDTQPTSVADRLASTLNAGDRPCLRLSRPERLTEADAGRPCISTATIMLADGPRWRQARRWDVVIWLRTVGHRERQDGEAGADIVVDLTPEMLARARAQGRAAYAALVLADARHLPLASGSVDAVFAAGLIMHLPDTATGLRQLARVTRPGGQLILFHPSGRAALAARHGRSLQPDDPLAAAPLRRLTRTTGWCLTTYDDAECRFFALATRE